MWRPGLVRFRKHHRLCGQPAVVGGTEAFRPLPAQVGHFKRINATPSDLPLMSTGLATYPVPPQCGQLFGSTPPPQLPESFSPICARGTRKLILLRNPNRPRSRQPEVAREKPVQVGSEIRNAMHMSPATRLLRKSCVKLMKTARRRGGRVAECGGLLNRCTG